MLFIVYFFYKNESHLYSPNEFLFRIWQKKYLNKFRLLALCWPIFFEIGGLSSPGSSRAWIPIFRAQETCLITKYLVNSSCEGKHELSFWGINQRTCEITRFSAWVAEAPLLGSFLQRQAGRKWCRSALAGAEQTLTHSKGLGSVPRTSRVHFEKLHRSSNQGIVAKCTRPCSPQCLCRASSPSWLRGSFAPASSCPPCQSCAYICSFFTSLFSSCSLHCCFSFFLHIVFPHLFAFLAVSLSSSIWNGFTGFIWLLLPIVSNLVKTPLI